MEALFIQITTGFTQGIHSRIELFVQWAPFVLGALVVFLFGWILAEMASRLILLLGHKVKLEWLAEKIGLKHFLEKRKAKKTPSEVIAHSTKGYLIFLFFIESTKVAGFNQVADFLISINGYIPELIIAIFIMLVGARVGHTLQVIITTSLSFAKSNTANALGLAIKYMVMTFAILAALSQLQIAEILVQTLFIGFVAMLTVAGGLSFGLGGKDVVKELLEDIKKVELKKEKND